METDVTVDALVREASDGSQDAWDQLVDRYTPLVMSVIRRHGLRDDDARDTYQTVWLRLVEHLSRIVDPRALPGWLSTTAKHECLRVIRARQRLLLQDPTALAGSAADEQAPGPDDRLLRAEQHEALLAAFAELPDHQRDLLALLLVDPPLSYEQIGRRLNVSIGYIGPTRRRALERLRRSPQLAALDDRGDGTREGETHGRTTVAGR